MRSCPVHGSAHSNHSVWRPVRQPSRESRRIFENENRPPCPIHKRPASVGTGSSHTAILDDEVVIIEPENAPEPEPIRGAASRHSMHSKCSKHSKHSKSQGSFSQKSLNEEEPPKGNSVNLSRSRSKCSAHSGTERSSSSCSTGIRYVVNIALNIELYDVFAMRVAFRVFPGRRS
ncbi:hypothetical protein Y032_0501g2590 [Ancylostoma ceylanicum]|uniref:Uncharacterized protein n=1 Tax=Ancylostoma ceylanicum TaxID=53326 RepID=A0A016WVW8_9BILA|nr:hypothetical protein Y032_0501g2590 [Ancylostoma ceylanicum]